MSAADLESPKVNIKNLSLTEGKDPKSNSILIPKKYPLTEGSEAGVDITRAPSADGEYTIKKICIEELYKSQGRITISKLLQHYSVLKSIDHPNVAQLIDTWLEGPNAEEILKQTYKVPETPSWPHLNFLVIQMEPYSTDLDHWLRSENPPLVTTDIFIQVMAGLTEIHDKGIIHGALVPSNIILKGDTWKIGDFGHQWAQNISCKDDEKNCGFQSPHMSKGDEDYSKKTDVYSIALNFLLILNPRLVQDDQAKAQVFSKLSEGLTVEGIIDQAMKDISNDFSTEMSIIVKMLNHNPKERPDSRQVFENLKEYSSRAEGRLKFEISPSDEKTSFMLSDPCPHFRGRDTEIGKFQSLCLERYMDTGRVEGRSGLKLVSIVGPPGVGKSELAKGIAKGFYKHIGSCSWICCKEIFGNFKNLCEESPRGTATSPWLIVFDGLDRLSLGYFRVILDELRENKKAVLTKFIIVTSRCELEGLGIQGLDLTIKLDFIK